jgi:hypothetical protein
MLAKVASDEAALLAFFALAAVRAKRPMAGQAALGRNNKVWRLQSAPQEIVRLPVKPAGRLPARQCDPHDLQNVRRKRGRSY